MEQIFGVIIRDMKGMTSSLFLKVTVCLTKF